CYPLSAHYPSFCYILYSFCSPSTLSSLLFFFNDTATTEIYTLSLHDALPISLPERQRLPGGDSQLPLDQIEPSHSLGHGVLHLQPRVHLHEVELAAIEQELDGARAHVADLARDHERRGAQPLAQRPRQPARRRLPDELLM